MKKGYVTSCFSSRLTTEIRKSGTHFTSEEMLLTISGCFMVGGGGGGGGAGRGQTFFAARCGICLDNTLISSH